MEDQFGQELFQGTRTTDGDYEQVAIVLNPDKFVWQDDDFTLPGQRE